jgi:hypothetical protein
MLSITLDYDVPASRDIAIRLPETIKPRKHKLIVVIDEVAPSSSTQSLQAFSGAIPEFAGVDAVALQRQWRDEWE